MRQTKNNISNLFRENRFECTNNTQHELIYGTNTSTSALPNETKNIDEQLMCVPCKSVSFLTTQRIL